MQSLEKLKFCEYCGGLLVWSEDILYDDPNIRYDGVTGKPRARKYAIGECPQRGVAFSPAEPGRGQPWHTLVEYPMEEGYANNS